VGITRALAVEWARSNVLVNAVAPGFTATGMSVVNGENELESDWFRQIYVDGGRLPIGRAADPAEIAALIAWLVSAQNTYVTGATLVADGGMTVRM
jgi:NAD(P)-dependent dehydrogenase (short-subunit alcohol dehydrogenase family)